MKNLMASLKSLGACTAKITDDDLSGPARLNAERDKLSWLGGFLRNRACIRKMVFFNINWWLARLNNSEASYPAKVA